jgi:hypothetical protein
VGSSSSIRRRAAAVRRVRVTEFPTTFAAIFLLCVAGISLRRGGLRAASRRVEWFCRPRVLAGARQGVDERIDRVTRNVHIAGELIALHGGCLPRSLVTRAQLRHAGINAELRIGVRSEPPALLAHAWVEFEGAPVNESREVIQHFAVFEGPVNPVLLEALD